MLYILLYTYNLYLTDHQTSTKRSTTTTLMQSSREGKYHNFIYHNNSHYSPLLAHKNLMEVKLLIEIPSSKENLSDFPQVSKLYMLNISNR